LLRGKRKERESIVTYPQKNAAGRRYLQRFIPTMVAYVVFLFFVEWYVHAFHPAGALLYALAILPAVPIVGVIVVFGLYLAEEKDEFQRNLIVQSMLWAIGGILALTSVWGFLQMFTRIPHFQPFLAFPLFWLFFGVSSAILRWKYR